MWKNGYIWNPATFSCENDKYVESIIGDSVIACVKLQKKQKMFQQKLLQQKLLQEKVLQ